MLNGASTSENRYSLDPVHRHSVRLVCCAHALLFDHHVRDGVHFVVYGGGGTGICSHLRGMCSAGEGNPEDRGALFHAVHVALSERGTISGRVLEASRRPKARRESRSGTDSSADQLVALTYARMAAIP